MYFTANFSFMPRTRVPVRASGLLASMLLIGGIASAQTRAQQLETRATLTERAAREERAGNKGKAAAIRTRLEEGDYQEGDRVVILLENMPVTGRGADPSGLNRADTLTVRTGRVLQFPQAKYQGVKDLDVAGVLHSEMPDKVREHLALIYNNPNVRVTSLVQLSVSGAVLRGGFVDVPPDMRLSDVFTYAGGLATDADLRKINILRGARELMTAKDVQAALDNSLTVDGAHLRAGDQINVPKKTSSNWMAVAGFAMSVLTVVIFLVRGR